MSDRYFIGQGKLYVGLRNTAGAVTGGWRFLGNCPELRIMQNIDYIEHYESQTGQRNKDLEIESTRNVMMQIAMESWDLDNLAFALLGTSSTINGTTVSNETVRSPSALGAFAPLANINLTSFTSLGSLVNGTDYKVDLKSGMVEFLAGGGATVDTNYTAAYVFANSEKIVALNAGQKEYWFRFAGLNTVENDTPVVIDVFRTRFRNAEELQLISNEVTPMQVQASVLYDGAQADGPFYRIRQARAA